MSAPDSFEKHIHSPEKATSTGRSIANAVSATISATVIGQIGVRAEAVREEERVECEAQREQHGLGAGKRRKQPPDEQPKAPHARGREQQILDVGE